jgi:hypothetical protein
MTRSLAGSVRTGAADRVGCERLFRNDARAGFCQDTSYSQNPGQGAGFRLSDRPRPNSVRPCPEDQERRPADHEALQIERVADRGMRLQEAPR